VKKDETDQGHKDLKTNVAVPSSILPYPYKRPEEIKENKEAKEREQ